MSVMRLISSSRIEIQSMSAKELKASIKGSEGRVIMSQLGLHSNVIRDASNPELAQAFGADMIMINGYPMDKDVLTGCEIQKYHGRELGWVTEAARLSDLKQYVDIPMGIYLECGNPEVMKNQEVTTYGWKEIAECRKAVKANFAKLKDEGAAFVVLAGNPGSGTTYDNIIQATREAKEVVGDDVLIFAGKWEDGNIQPILGDPVLGQVESKRIITELIDVGADCITLAMPGARTGISTEDIRELTTFIHTYKPGTLVLSFLDGSIEGADEETIRLCSLESKKTGADIHAIGDAGLHGIAVPEDIYTMAIALKGRRLTWKRLAGSRR